MGRQSLQADAKIKRALPRTADKKLHATDRPADLRLLILDDAAGAELVINALHDAGIRCKLKLVDSEAAFVRELGDFAPDLVLAGSSQSAYSGRLALEFTRRTHPQIPVIMMSDRVAAEETIASVKAGAGDYIFKDDLTRLVPAVLAAVRWEHERRARGRTEELLRVSEVRYRRLFEAAKDGILILDADTGQILDANPFMIELLGYSLDEYLGKHLWEIGAFADLVASQEAFEELRQNRYIRYENMPLRTRDGRMVDVEFVSNVYPEGGRDTIQCNIRDITERRVTERKLFQAQKMAAVGILTGGVAHNINNLLTVIIGNIDMLRERTVLDRESARCTQVAIEAALSGAGLVRHMLAFARQQPLRPRRIDVNDLVFNTAKTLRSLLGGDIKLSLRLTEEAVWPVSTDPALLESSIINLAVNAREAMPHGGRLIISTGNRHLGADADVVEQLAAPGDYVEIAVSDTGTGMSPDVMQRIFEPFFSTKGLADKPGIGLGLSSVLGFVQQSGGNIGVESKVAVGTTFRLFLPRFQEVESTDEAPGPARLPGGNETVLVVEDNAEVRGVVVQQLQLLGYHVLQCEDAVAALVVLSEKRIDLLFSDIVMPGEVDGLKLARNAIAHWPSLKVLLTTGYGDVASRGDVRGLRVLEKPYRTADLAGALREALDRDKPAIH